MLGQVSASHGGLRRASIGLLPLLLTLALIVILDLDRTGEGSILVSQQPLADLDAIKSRRYHREAFRNRCGLPGRSGPATSPLFELHQWNIRKCRSPRLPDADRASLGQGKGGAAAPPLFGAVKLLVNSWPAISEIAKLASRSHQVKCRIVLQRMQYRLAAFRRKDTLSRLGGVWEGECADWGSTSAPTASAGA